jgi:hypothetical protein
VREAWSWDRLDRKGGAVYRCRTSEGGEFVGRDLAVIVSTVHRDTLVDLAPDPAWLDLVVEGLFVPRIPTKKAKPGGKPPPKFNPQSVIPLAESAGIILGLLSGIAATTSRPLAVEWRHRVLGLAPNTPADEAEAFAVRMAPALFEGLGALAHVGAVCEAAWIARDGWVQATQRRAA